MIWHHYPTGFNKSRIEKWISKNGKLEFVQNIEINGVLNTKENNHPPVLFQLSNLIKR